MKEFREVSFDVSFVVVVGPKTTDAMIYQKVSEAMKKAMQSLGAPQDAAASHPSVSINAINEGRTGGILGAVGPGMAASSSFRLGGA